MAAFRYLINRMSSLPLSAEKRKAEWQNIRNIANNNKFPIHLITKLRTQIQRKPQMNIANNNNNNNRPTFTYHSPKVRMITNLFKQTDIKIAFKSTNTLQQLIKPKAQDTTQEHDKSGIYKLTCKTCNKVYIGQTSRNLTIRYREHIRYIKNNDPQSAYTLHILQNRHEYGPLKDTMTLLKPIHKSSMLIPYEQLLIQTFHQNGTLIPEQKCNEQNQPTISVSHRTQPHVTNPPQLHFPHDSHKPDLTSHTGSLHNYLNSTDQYIPQDSLTLVLIRPRWKEVAVPVCE